MSLYIEDIAQKLDDDSVGTVATDIFVGWQTEDMPEAVIVVLESTGLSPDRYLPTARPGFQIYIRNKSYAAGAAKAQAVRNSLHQTLPGTLVTSGNFFYYIFALQEPIYIGRDEQERHEWTINFVSQVRIPS